MEIKILYEDEYILALNKPTGLLVHSDGRSKEPTLVDWINENYPDLKEVGEEQTLQNGEKIKRPGIVHRLDKDTSGVIVVAKTKEAHQFLKEQFKNRKIEKIYNAIVWGNFNPSTSLRAGEISEVINKPIGRSAGDFRKWSSEHGAKGEMREAVTEYKVIAQRSYAEQNKIGFSYLEIRPKTGRTHQIRVHLKSISHPVVCDKLYASGKVCNEKECLGFSRLALHALSVKLELPNRTHITIESPLPPEFENTKNLLKNG
jgi:23S rRNA pseudouridine1911/1915/1917 synthase